MLVNQIRPDVGTRIRDLQLRLLSRRPRAEDARVDGRRVFLHPSPLLQHLPEPLLLAVVVQDGLLRHPGHLAAVVAALFAFLPVLDVDLASVVLLARELGDLGVEVRPSPKCAAAEARHAPVVADKLLENILKIWPL